MEENFDSIRPFNDEEVPGVIARLIKEPILIKLLQLALPDVPFEKIVETLHKIENRDEFQAFMDNIVKSYIQKTTTRFSYTGLENIAPDKKYLFISNHRDIILDSAFINDILFSNGMPTTEIAIGSNLLIYDWIHDLVKLNKAFIVERGINIRQQLWASQRLSAYIRYAINEKGTSVWLAQREGRTKDGNDQTQISLLKMLNMSAGNMEIRQAFANLNIVPVAISYEYEPCDKSKVKELYIRKLEGKFEKKPEDDLQSMANGIRAFKGEVKISFGKPINQPILNIDAAEDKNAVVRAVAQLIDEQIYSMYNLTKVNYIAYDLLNKTRNGGYSDAEQTAFVEYMKKQLADIEGNHHEIEKIFLSIYAHPVVNAGTYQHISKKKTNYN